MNNSNRPDPAAATELYVAPLEETADEKCENAQPRPSKAEAALSIFGTLAMKAEWLCFDDDLPSLSS